MLNIFPFCGLRYNLEKIGNLSQVVTQPYDKIDEELQNIYYERHPYNIVRIIRGKDLPGDNENYNKYTRAKEHFHKWLEEGIFKEDVEPALYVYHQEYKGIDGEINIRKGFITLLQLQEFGEGGILPHEKTLASPKKDRLLLLRETEALFENIFMLYSDPQNQINKLFSPLIQRTPDMQAIDDYGETNKVWIITDEKVISEVQNAIQDKIAFIADGHHRYETSLNYRREMLEKGVKCIEPHSINNIMVSLINMDDEGLTILPTHRVLFNIVFDLKDLLKKLGDYFEVICFQYDPEEKMEIARQFMEVLKDAGKEKPAFGMYAKNSPFYVLTLKDFSLIDPYLDKSHSEVWRRLDVNVLHSVIIEHMLGITPEKVEQQANIAYLRYYEEAIAKVDAGKYQLAFLMNPTKINQVKEVALNMEKMPQKSTDFYPKLLSGLVASRFKFVR